MVFRRRRALLSKTNQIFVGDFVVREGISGLHIFFARLPEPTLSESGRRFHAGMPSPRGSVVLGMFGMLVIFVMFARLVRRWRERRSMYVHFGSDIAAIAKNISKC